MVPEMVYLGIINKEDALDEKGCHKTPALTREQVEFYLDQFRNTDVTGEEQKQRLIDSFVNAVYVYDDKIILTFNCKDSTRPFGLVI